MHGGSDKAGKAVDVPPPDWEQRFEVFRIGWLSFLVNFSCGKAPRRFECIHFLFVGNSSLVGDSLFFQVSSWLIFLSGMERFLSHP